MQLKKILGFSFGPLFSSILGFITVPLLTWYFSKEDIGRLTLFNVVLPFFISIFSLGLDQAYVREYYESNNKLSLFIYIFFSTLLFLCLFVFGITYYFWDIFLKVFETDDIFVKYTIAFSIIFSFILNYLSMVLRVQERAFQYSLSQLIPKVTTILLLLLLFTILNYENTFRNLLLIYLISIIFAIIYSLKKISFLEEKITIIKKDTIFRILSYSIPIMISSILFWGITNLDKIGIKYFSNLNELAVYSVAMSFATIGMILYNIVSTIWAPHAYKKLSTNEGFGAENISNMLDKISVLVFSILFLSVLLSWIIDYILPATYLNVKYLFPICLSFSMFLILSEITVTGINITKRTKLLVGITLIVFIAGLILNYFFIQRYGSTGAAIANAISFYILFILKTEISVHIWKKFSRLKVYMSSFIYLLFLIIFVLFVDSSNYLLFQIVNIFIYIIIMIIFKDVIVEIYKYIKENFTLIDQRN